MFYDLILVVVLAQGFSKFHSDGGWNCRHLNAHSLVWFMGWKDSNSWGLELFAVLSQEDLSLSLFIFPARALQHGKFRAASFLT